MCTLPFLPATHTGTMGWLSSPIPALALLHLALGLSTARSQTVGGSILGDRFRIITTCITRSLQRGCALATFGSVFAISPRSHYDSVFVGPDGLVNRVLEKARMPKTRSQKLVWVTCQLPSSLPVDQLYPQNLIMTPHLVLDLRTVYVGLNIQLN